MSSTQKSTIEITGTVTVGELADKLMIPAASLIAELFKNGVMVTVNERIDFDTAQIIVEEMGAEVELVKKEQESKVVDRKSRKQASGSGKERPPVVAVMGHVDHGKTSLLDAIRESNVSKGEAGGITRHISAYQITHNDRVVTFSDTPGHEAFAALREHGAHLTDVVVIVVAADDGIKPQTLEAIRFARKAGVNIVVAINKTDKPADENRVKQQLSENDLMPEDWGGDTVVVPVSAKTKQGIDKLLEVILLVADVEELKADYDVPATGLVIEAHMEQGKGPIAVALVEQGRLETGQFVVAGTTYAKVRTLVSTAGENIKVAGPSTPVVIAGFKELPDFGNEFEVVKSEKEARNLVEQRKREQTQTDRSGVESSLQLMQKINRDINIEELPVIIKADVKGSLTSVIDSLKTLDNDEVSVRVVGSGVGSITENDLHRAKTGKALVYGFNVDMPANIKRLAARDQIKVRLYKVIYELIEDVRAELSSLLKPEVVETPLGRLVVKGVFRQTKTDIICGGEVSKGSLKSPALAKIYRDKTELAEVEVVGLKKGPTEVPEVQKGEMCGLQLKTENKVDLVEGDHIEVFSRETITRKI